MILAWSTIITDAGMSPAGNSSDGTKWIDENSVSGRQVKCSRCSPYIFAPSLLKGGHPAIILPHWIVASETKLSDFHDFHGRKKNTEISKIHQVFNTIYS